MDVGEPRRVVDVEPVEPPVPRDEEPVEEPVREEPVFA